MSNFYSSCMSCLTYSVTTNCVTTNVIKVIQVLTFFLISLICSNITMLHITVPEIWSIV